MTKTRILVVDDELIGRQLLQAVLLPVGFDVELAENGEEAIEKALTTTPDLILMDVMMPGLDGYDTVRELKTHDSLESIPVLMVTALDDRDSRIRGLESGAVDYITKPFDRVEVINKIRNRTSNPAMEMNNVKSTSSKKTEKQKTIIDTLVYEILDPKMVQENFTGEIEVSDGSGEFSSEIGQWTYMHNQTEYLCFFGPRKYLEQTKYQNCLISMWLWNSAKDIASDPGNISKYIQSRINSSVYFTVEESPWWFLVFVKSPDNEIKSSGFNQPILVLYHKDSSTNPYIINAQDNQSISFNIENVVFIFSREILEQLDNKIIVEEVKNHKNNPEFATFTSIIKSLNEKTNSEDSFGIKISF